MKTLIAALVATATATAVAVPARAATVIHSNDVLGEIEPCGCRTNPLGGITRKANWMKRLGDSSLLQLDAGDTLFATENVPALMADQTELQAGFHLRALDLLHHDAIVPGEKDFGLGVKVFERLRKKTKVKFLAANLTRKNGGKLFEPSAFYTRKGPNNKDLRIAVIGLVGEKLTWPKELKATSALAAAKAQVPALRKKADIVIALTHQGYDKDLELANAVPGIDLIIGGHTQTFLQKPAEIAHKAGKTWIFQSSFRNQYVGAIPLPFQGEGYQLTGLDAGYDSPADQPSQMDGLVKDFKAAVAELNSRQESVMQAGLQTAGGKTKLQSFPACGQCHLKQFDFWRKTPHVRAFASIVEKQQSRNKECLNCHTLGLGNPQGFTDVNRLAEASGTPLSHEDLSAYLKALSGAKNLDEPVKVRAADAEPVTVRESLGLLEKSWTPVQCENCHAPGGDHPFGGTYSKKVDDSACLKCHTFERAPGWYSPSGQLDREKLQTKRAQITCPAGDGAGE